MARRRACLPNIPNQCSVKDGANQRGTCHGFSARYVAPLAMQNIMTHLLDVPHLSNATREMLPLVAQLQTLRRAMAAGQGDFVTYSGTASALLKRFGGASRLRNMMPTIRAALRSFVNAVVRF